MLYIGQVISSVTGNKQCVSNIADANVLQFVLLVLYMLPSCEYSGAQHTCIAYTLCILHYVTFVFPFPPSLSAFPSPPLPFTFPSLSLHLPFSFLPVPSPLSPIPPSLPYPFPSLSLPLPVPLPSSSLSLLLSSPFPSPPLPSLSPSVPFCYAAHELVLEVFQALTSNTQIVKESIQKGRDK